MGSDLRSILLFCYIETIVMFADKRFYSSLSEVMDGLAR